MLLWTLTVTIFNSRKKKIGKRFVFVKILPIIRSAVCLMQQNITGRLIAECINHDYLTLLRI